jgi:hypothetical protein
MGMKEGDRRDVPARSNLQSGPRRVEGIASFDQVWLQFIQHADPAARRERQAVVEGPGNGADSAGVQGGDITRHQQGVLPMPLPGIPAVLGVEVAPDTAARRGKEQRCVDEMHAYPTVAA